METELSYFIRNGSGVLAGYLTLLWVMFFSLVVLGRWLVPEQGLKNLGLRFAYYIFCVASSLVFSILCYLAHFYLFYTMLNFHLAR